MYLLFTAVCKIQISCSLNVNVQRSCTSALNAMVTTRGTSGNASNCREESDISDRRAETGGYYFTCFTLVTGRKSPCCSYYCMWLQMYLLEKNKQKTKNTAIGWLLVCTWSELIFDGHEHYSGYFFCNYSDFFLLVLFK